MNKVFQLLRGSFIAFPLNSVHFLTGAFISLPFIFIHFLSCAFLSWIEVKKMAQLQKQYSFLLLTKPLPPCKLTGHNGKSTIFFQMYFLFKQVGDIFHCYVRLPEGTPKKLTFKPQASGLGRLPVEVTSNLLGRSLDVKKTEGWRGTILFFKKNRPWCEPSRA